MEKQAVTLTREELYTQVWTTPVERLAKTYGISGRGLSKICARLDIPVPPRGYWARLAAGQEVVKYRLPVRGEGIPGSIEIGPTPPPPLPEPTPAVVQTAIQTQLIGRPSVKIAKTLANPHPLIEQWIEENRRDVAAHRHDRFGWKPEALDGTVLKKRRLLILNALFKALEHQGHKIAIEQPYRYFPFAEIDRQKVEFILEERIQQSRAPLTPAERREHWNSDRKWKRIDTPTGKLRFRIKTHYAVAGLKTEWIDKEEDLVENHIDEILASMVALAALRAEQERERKAEDTRRMEEAHRRRLAEEEKQKESNRWRHVVDMALRSQRVAVVAQFIDRMEETARGQAGGKKLSENLAVWLAWARERLRDDDPLAREVGKLMEQNMLATPRDRPMQWAEDSEEKPRGYYPG